MAVQKSRKSPSKRGMRRAHDALVFTAAVDLCDNCGEVVQRHRVCGACGHYRGRKVLNVAAES